MRLSWLASFLRYNPDFRKLFSEGFGFRMGGYRNVYVQALNRAASIRRKITLAVDNRPIILNELKTRASKRNVPIPPQLVECLREVKETSTSDFVIANRDGAALSETQWQQLWGYVRTRMVKEWHYYRYVNGQKIRRTVTPVLGERATHNNKVVYSIDFDVTPHQLRHTYITNLLLTGVDVKTVQYLAGHEHAKITLDIYVHLTYIIDQRIYPKRLIVHFQVKIGVKRNRKCLNRLRHNEVIKTG